MLRRFVSLFVLLLPATACNDDSQAESSDAMIEAIAPAVNVPLTGPDPLVDRPRGTEQLAIMCSHEGDDPLRSLFCGDEPIQLQSLVDLQKALFIDASRLKGVNGLALAGHSTSLGARGISSINPRAIAVRLEHPEFDAKGNATAPGTTVKLTPALEIVAIAFSRGEQLIELMVRDRGDHELRFYLLAFRQACNDSDDGCKPSDLLTPEIEQNWTETSLYDETDLANTVLDCATCHQTNGPGTPKFVRMQELSPPWTHWFGQTDGGRALFADYWAAKGDEPFFGLAEYDLMYSNPVNLNLQAIYGGPNKQPNPFDSQTIEDEVRASAAAKGGSQPEDNTIAGESESWRQGYETARRGEAITFPYHDVKISDPVKLEQMTEAYRAYREGEIDRSELPDIREVLPDDHERLAEMGLATKPGAPGDEVLLEACAMCHNERLDQSLSRARFRANLAGMDRKARDLAIERLRLPEDDPHAMPPPRLRRLTSEARKRAIEALMK